MVGQVVVAAGAAVAGALAGKIFGAGGKGAKGDPVFSVAAAANYDHESEIEKYAHLAQIYPEVDAVDVKTPDNWIKRHPHMIRLTGKHPFNVEAPLPEMFDYGES
mmetsp:Transcript_6864/g.10604  ORF Transcript_6864/g.10604 Transcript_6864/m.10604 type:complete len:105 (+) Transcript_6864:197-511(+)